MVYKYQRAKREEGVESVNTELFPKSNLLLYFDISSSVPPVLTLFFHFL
jgi:hypothetical protein